jgi:hypothetical protein
VAKKKNLAAGGGGSAKPVTRNNADGTGSTALDYKFETGGMPQVPVPNSGLNTPATGYGGTTTNNLNPGEEIKANWKTGEIDLSTLGTTGLKQYGGFVTDEWSPFLQNLYAIRQFREMEDNSTAVGAMRFLIRVLMSQVEWYMEPPDELKDSSEAKEVCDFVEECRTDMSHDWLDYVSEALSMLTYGFAPFEVTYKIRGGEDVTIFDKYSGADIKDSTRYSYYSDNKIGWRKFTIRAQETLLRWEFAQVDRQLRGMHQWDPYAGRGAFLPIEKMMLLRTEVTRDNPNGRSLYRSAYVEYKMLKRIQEIEAIGVEHDLTGMLKMTVPIELLVSKPNSQNIQLRASIEKGLAALKRDERGFILLPPEVTEDGKPTGFKLELLKSGGAHQLDTTKIKNYYRTNILQSCLAQFLQLGQQDMAGSRALSSDHTDLFALGLYTLVDQIVKPFNQYAVKRLLAANDMPVKIAPKLKHGDIEAPPLEEVSKFLVNLATAGVPFQSRDLTDKLMEMAALPKPELNEGYVAPGAPGAPGSNVQPDSDPSGAAQAVAHPKKETTPKETSPDDPSIKAQVAKARERDELEQTRKWLLKKSRWHKRR